MILGMSSLSLVGRYSERVTAPHSFVGKVMGSAYELAPFAPSRILGAKSDSGRLEPSSRPARATRPPACSRHALSTHPMAKRKIDVKIKSYGIYTHWDSESKELPHIEKFTTRVHAFVGVEFGFVATVTGAKNQKLTYCIEHPGILDAEGERRPPFDGEVHVKTQEWDFYLGDTIWEPIHDKLGPWRMWLAMDGKIVAEKTFDLL